MKIAKMKIPPLAVYVLFEDRISNIEYEKGANREIIGIFTKIEDAIEAWHIYHFTDEDNIEKHEVIS